MPQPKTVLIVDDEDAIRLLLRECLRRCGYVLLDAANGADALAITRAQHQQIDILVSDVMMPGMTGPELAAELREQRPDLKVVLISGSYDKPFRMEQGWELLQKPFLPSSLCDTLQRICASVGP